MDGLAKCEETFHENEVLEYYCKECNVCICLKCGQTRHDRHNKCEIQQAAEEQKVTMAEVVEEAKAEVVVIESKMDEQIELRSKSKARNVAAQDKVTEIVENLVRVLKEHELNIKTKLVEIDETQEKDHEAQMIAFQMFAEKLKNSIERSEGVFQRGVAVEVLQEESCKDLLNQSQEMKLYKPEFVNYVPKREVVNALTRLASGLGQVVTSNTDHSQSVAVGKGLKEAEVAIEANFTITTRDSEGKQFYSEQDHVTAIISSPTGKEEVQIRDCKDGNYTAHYQPKDFGRHDVQVEINGWPLTGSPWIVDVKPHHYKVVSSCGSYGTEEGEFDEPWSVAKDEATGHIAVADFGNKRIQVFQEEWKYLRTIQGVKLGHPISVAFSKNSDIIVTHAEDIDLHSLKLSAITDRGQFIEQFSEHLIKPYSVSVTNDGHGHVIVCDAGDKKIKVLSPDGVELLQSFCDPHCNRSPELALYHRDIFVVYYWAHCVKVFNEKGVYLYDIGSEESCEECLIRPVGLAVDSFQNLIVCDTGNWRLKVFTLDGKFVTSIADEIRGPWFVAVCKNGDVIVADAFKHCIHVLQ